MDSIGTINFEDFRVKGSKIFIGRDVGKHVKIESRINELEKSCSSIDFIIPDNVYSISPSFFEDLLTDVVQKLGKEKFFEKFNFKSLGDYNYKKTLMESIYRISRDGNALCE